MKLLIACFIGIVLGWLVGFMCGDSCADWKHHQPIKEDYIQMLKEKRELRKQYKE